MAVQAFMFPRAANDRRARLYLDLYQLLKGVLLFGTPTKSAGIAQLVRVPKMVQW